MYFGHFAVALAAKPFAPKASLGVMLVASQAIDILYAVFVVAGVAAVGVASYWDHGLVMTSVWSVVSFGIALSISRDLRSSAAVGLTVFSHWVADFIAYDRALPLAFKGSPRVGLGLYSSPVVMVATDLALFGGAIAFYLLRTRPEDRTGRWAFWLLVGYILAVTPACALPGKLIAIAAALMAGTLPLGIWIDRHRCVIPAAGSARSLSPGKGG